MINTEGCDIALNRNTLVGLFYALIGNVLNPTLSSTGREASFIGLIGLTRQALKSDMGFGREMIETTNSTPLLYDELLRLVEEVGEPQLLEEEEKQFEEIIDGIKTDDTT